MTTGSLRLNSSSTHSRPGNSGMRRDTTRLMSACRVDGGAVRRPAVRNGCSDHRPISRRLPRKLRDVAHKTIPLTNSRWRCHSNCAIGSSHRVADRDQRVDAEHLRQCGDIVGTIGEPEPSPANAATVPTVIDGDDAVPPAEWLERPHPVQTAGGGQPVEQHDDRRARWAGYLADERRAAARKLDRAAGRDERRCSAAQLSRPTISTFKMRSSAPALRSRRSRRLDVQAALARAASPER